jgi:hypothetical protein
VSQPGLFEAKPTMKSPICCRERHCGSRVECDEPRDLGGCVNVDVRCLHCGATGVLSTRKDLA